MTDETSSKLIENTRKLSDNELRREYLMCCHGLKKMPNHVYLSSIKSIFEEEIRARNMVHLIYEAQEAVYPEKHGSFSAEKTQEINY